MCFSYPWTKNEQTAAISSLQAYTLMKGPLKVAVRDHTPFEPALYFTASSLLLQQDSDVSACVSADVAAATRRRALQQTPVEYKITTPGEWSYSVRYNSGETINGQRVGNAGIADHTKHRGESQVMCLLPAFCPLTCGRFLCLSHPLHASICSDQQNAALTFSSQSNNSGLLDCAVLLI